jgi:hypothetical protein
MRRIKWGVKHKAMVFKEAQPHPSSSPNKDGPHPVQVGASSSEQH